MWGSLAENTVETPSYYLWYCIAVLGPGDTKLTVSNFLLDFLPSPNYPLIPLITTQP